MKTIITSKMANLLVIQLDISIVELKENGVIVSDQLPLGKYTATVKNVFQLNLIDDVKAETFVIQKEPSYTKFNKGKFSKKQRREHNY